AGGLAARRGPGQAAVSGVMMFFAVATWIAARMIPPSRRAAPNLNLDFQIPRSTFPLLGALKAGPRVWWGGPGRRSVWALGVGWPGQQLVLAHRRGRAVAPSAPGPDSDWRRRDGHHRVPRRVRDRDRHRVRPGVMARTRPHRFVSHAACRSAARDFCARSRLD